MASLYNKSRPCKATLQKRCILNQAGSSKETLHIELSLPEDFHFAPGDAVAVMPKNDASLVEKLLKAMRLSSKAELEAEASGGKVDLQTALKESCDLSLRKPMLKRYQAHLKSEKLEALLSSENTAALKDYCEGRDVLDLLQDFPIELSAAQWFKTLGKLQPRLYSVASSLKACPKTVHLLVGVVRYELARRAREGIASGYFTKGLQLGDAVELWPCLNRHFKLPEAMDAPIIMVGPGTGLAPFRAFLQERRALGAAGENWLFFGERQSAFDFYYQAELETFLREGFLTHLDTAFSRDASEKAYVQHRIEEKGERLWHWLREGAFVYVCGDASRMAADVHRALIRLGCEHGGLSPEASEAFWADLKSQGRYSRDVY